MPKKQLPYPTRFTVKGSDIQCWCRACMRPGEDKGSFTVGRGYTSYHAQPLPVCLCNHLEGCPYPLPEPDPENARCCYRPEYHKKGTAPSCWLTCSTCDAVAPKAAVRLLNALPSKPGVACRHLQAEPSVVLGWWECPDCRKGWDHRPQPHEVPQYLMEDILAELEWRLKRTSDQQTK